METSKTTAQFDSVKSAADGNRLMQRLVDVAQPASVFSQPVKVGEYTLITASTVSTSVAFGYGGGYGQPAVQHAGEPAGSANPGSDTPGTDAPATGIPEVGGGGGGGGGFSMGRPVAVISVGPNGVRIDPIVDVTRIGAAVFTTIARVFFAMRGRRQHHHG